VAHLYLVRHAKAGERRLWTGADVDRPLSKKGRKQAELVGDRLARLDPTALLSSPYVRCVQTLLPLGERTELTVEIDDRLREDEPVGPAIDLLRECAGGTVLCSHGDIIPAVIQAFEEAGTEIRTPPDWRKASVWVLKRDRRDRVVHATVWPPPAP
jgi:8-oxo-dGTP diphosphatase